MPPPSMMVSKLKQKFRRVWNSQSSAESLGTARLGLTKREDSATQPVLSDGDLQVETPLCSECQKFIIRCSPRKRKWSRSPIIVLSKNFHRGSEETIHKAAAGCGICYKLSEWLCSHNTSDFPSLRRFRVEGDFERLFIRFRMRDNTDDYDLQFRFIPLAVDKCFSLSTLSQFYEGIRFRPNEFASTGSDAALHLASLWLQECSTKHQVCQEGHEPDFKPPRLLDLEETRSRLLDDTSTLPNSRYAALSHCWGDNPDQLKLTATNLATFCDGLRASDLPKTFRDAVLICQSLQIRYLWIDSLCILQHDPHQSGDDSHARDWKKHVGIMNRVYQNSAINIAAAHGTNSNSGCFITHRKALFSPYVVKMQTRKDKDPEPVLCTVLNYNLAQNIRYESVIRYTHLDTRGWVMQERLMSRRTLHFTDTQIFWECSKVPLACESYPIGLWPTFLAPYSWQTVEKSDQIDRWLELLGQYTTRRLTRPEDRLPAIAGVARGIAAFVGDEYYAGLFRSTLPQSLLWQKNTEYLSPVAKCSIPTWSWARLDGSKGFWNCHLEVDDWEVHCSVLGISVLPAVGHDIFGCTESGHITLFGPCVKFDRGETPESELTGSRRFETVTENIQGGFILILEVIPTVDLLCICF